MKMSLSNLLRWGNGRKAAASGDVRKGMARAETAAGPVGERRKSIRWPKDELATLFWLDKDGTTKTASVWMKNSGDGGSAVVSDKPVESGQSAWLITQEGEDRQAVIRYCTEASEGYQVGLERLKAKKAEPRPAGTCLSWIEKSGKLVYLPVSVRNSGDGKLEVVSAKAAPAPALAMISGLEYRCLGAITACHKRGSRFLLDVDVVSESYKQPGVAA
jgi:hypothetical protein